MVTDTPSNWPLCRLRDLAGAVQVHQPGREHLGVDAVVAAVAVGEQADDGRRDAADAGLERGAVGDERADVLGDRAVGVGRLGVGEEERVAVGLDEHVDLVDVDAVRVQRPSRTCAGTSALVSTTRTRSGSAPARWIASTVAPACSESET